MPNQGSPMRLTDRLYERHCQGDDLCGKAQKEIELLRRLLREGLAVADDLIMKTDIYLGINDAYARHEKWETDVKEII